MNNSLDVLKKISAHQVQGVMLHRDMMVYYDFLGLHCFKKMHKLQLFQELCCNNKINRYAINHLNRIIILDNVNPIFHIPSNWGNVDRMDVTNNNRQTYLKSGMEQWYKWECSTKELYSNAYKELCDTGDYVTAKKVMDMICDSDMEIKNIEHWIIKLEKIEYDIPMSLSFEDEINKKYDKKMAECCF